MLRVYRSDEPGGPGARQTPARPEPQSRLGPIDGCQPMAGCQPPFGGRVGRGRVGTGTVVGRRVPWARFGLRPGESGLTEHSNRMRSA